MELLIEPKIDWNPQREDIPTPFLQKPDWSQCMGNSFQSIINWCGSIFPEKIKLLDKNHFNTYNYYNIFEAWLKDKKFIIKDKNGIWKDPDQSLYTMSYHVNHFNELMIKNSVSIRAVYYDNAILKKLVEHITKTKIPCVLGTKLTNEGHIIRIVGYNDDNNKISLIVSDPWGEYPYTTNIQKSDGHYKYYPINIENNLIYNVKITRMTLFEKTS